jgi:hypothetical protein
VIASFVDHDGGTYLAMARRVASAAQKEALR